MSRVRSPELPADFPWLNCDRPLSLAELRGRVVVLDFWTYCCINCLHILPDLKYLETKYADSLTVIGVHSAKFDNERDVDNIRQAILRHDIEHPVIVDRDFYIWQQYAVRAWPTLVIIDPLGYCIRTAAGEGNREALDEMLGNLIRDYRERGKITPQTLNFNREKRGCPLTTPLAFPGKVLADSTQNRLFVADSGHHRLIVGDLDGDAPRVIGTGTPGWRDGSFADTQFFAPQGMAISPDGNFLYVADTENHAIRKIDFTTQTVETVAGTGRQSRYIYPHGGRGTEVALNSPWDVEWVENRLFVAMAGSHQIWVWDPDGGRVQTYAGRGAESCVDGELLAAAFSQPSGLAADGSELFVADSESSSIRGVGLGDNPRVRTIGGSGELFGFGEIASATLRDRDSRGFNVRLQHCLGVEYANKSLWVADTYNHKIKRVDPQTGDSQTILGTEAQLAEPSGLSAIGDRLYIADTNNHAILVLKLDTLAISTVEFKGLCAPNFCIPDRSAPA
ncbi:thioredoxin-like domain-containing protein [Lyngbya sp. CCY1209]|uniref:thioredoxin-like domain-containing protein n=1 Tax=Lyngbya sp. CCY1209 TaxID=2886103 RepID=UPI002D2046E0|nr:thioredoxin-like domain-containing protein [Lyngbya sp. CCY1209]MEB3882202.1 redoxin domain-containing protein [Lyngbya sp. CCY1209]